MEIRLEKAAASDAPIIFESQVKAFKPLLEKYKDYDTNPANETIERVQTRITHPESSYFKILLDNCFAGAIRIVWEENSQFWISPLFILPEYQGRGAAQKVIQLIFEMFPQAKSWELATIKEEEGNCYLYEKMGFIQTGVEKKLNEHATLVYYKGSVLSSC